jgi:hypothetical protein
MQLQLVGQRAQLVSERALAAHQLEGLNSAVARLVTDVTAKILGAAAAEDLWVKVLEVATAYTAEKPTELSLVVGERCSLLCDEDRATWLVSRRSRSTATDSVGYAPPHVFVAVCDSPAEAALRAICQTQLAIRSALNVVEEAVLEECPIGTFGPPTSAATLAAGLGGDSADGSVDGVGNGNGNGNGAAGGAGSRQGTLDTTTLMLLRQAFPPPREHQQRTGGVATSALAAGATTEAGGDPTDASDTLGRTASWSAGAAEPAEGWWSAKLPAGWEAAVDHLGCKYFVNHFTKETTWLHPITNRPAQPTQTTATTAALPDQSGSGGRGLEGSGTSFGPNRGHGRGSAGRPARREGREGRPHGGDGGGRGVAVGHRAPPSNRSSQSAAPPRYASQQSINLPPGRGSTNSYTSGSAGIGNGNGNRDSDGDGDDVGHDRDNRNVVGLGRHSLDELDALDVLLREIVGIGDEAQL